MVMLAEQRRATGDAGLVRCHAPARPDDRPGFALGVADHAIGAQCPERLAAAAGFSILEAGGNAIDAGCAAGIALAVLHPDEVNVAGVAPIMIRLGAQSTSPGKVVTIAGLGHWPKRFPADLFMREQQRHQQQQRQHYSHTDNAPHRGMRAAAPAGAARCAQATAANPSHTKTTFRMEGMYHL